MKVFPILFGSDVNEEKMLDFSRTKWTVFFLREQRKLISLSSSFYYCFFLVFLVSVSFHPHFTIRILSSAFFHPHFIIRIFPSAFYHPHFSIRHPPSAAIRSAFYRDPTKTALLNHSTEIQDVACCFALLPSTR